MHTFFRQLGRALPAGSVMLMMAACSDSTTAPTTADAMSAKTAATTTATAAQEAASVLVSGTVVDSSNRPLAGAVVECMAELNCKGFGDVSEQDGGDFNVATNANGVYRIIVERSAGSTGDSFTLHASARAHQTAFESARIPDPACTPDQARCAVTVNFKLTPQLD